MVRRVTTLPGAAPDAAEVVVVAAFDVLLDAVEVVDVEETLVPVKVTTEAEEVLLPEDVDAPVPDTLSVDAAEAVDCAAVDPPVELAVLPAVLLE